MRYDKGDLESIAKKYSEVSRIHEQLMLRLFLADSRIHEAKAKEYLTHGVARRLGTLTRCIHNVFTIFPVERTELLAPEELTDLEINLHAFFVNIAGLFDNLAWVFAIETALVGSSKVGKLSKKEIGLFNKKTQFHFPSKIRVYLNSDHIIKWYSEYSKNYRDALAHRIPLYIPPFIIIEEDQERYLALEEKIRALNHAIPTSSSVYDKLRAEQRKLGKLSLVFRHSFGEESTAVLLHSQLIIDYLTIEEVIKTVSDELWLTPE